MVEDYQENYITGWIKVYRSFINWEWYTAPNMAHFFMYCLLKANHKDNKWRGIEIKKGQFITSLETMKNETGLSIQQVRTCLKRLKKTGEINTLSNKQNTIITICKYDTYQSFSNEDNTQSNKQITNDQQTPNKRLTTNNNDNNIKNDNNTIPGFEIFKIYALEKSEKLKYELDLKKLELKYESWVENKWKTGGKNSRKIKNWKSTLLNTLPYLQKEKSSAQKEKVLTLAEKMKQDYGIK